MATPTGEPVARLGKVVSRAKRLDVTVDIRGGSETGLCTP